MVGYLQDAAGYLGVGVIFLGIFFGGFELYLRKGKRAVSIAERIALVGLGIYLIVIFSVTASPMYGYTGAVNWNDVNFSVGAVLASAATNPLNLFGNIAMFVPIGFLLPFVSRKCQKIYVTVIFGCLTSLMIEVCQLFNSRASDVDDIILNTLGTLLGYLGAVLILVLIPKIRNMTGIHQKKVKGWVKKDQFVVAMLIVCTLCSVMVTGTGQRMHYMSSAALQGVPESTAMADKDNPIRTALEKISISAKNAYVLDETGGKSLYEKRAENDIAPASTTKMVTALTVLDYCNLEDSVTVGDELNAVAADASRAGLMQGEIFTVKELLKGMLLPSGNDAAYVLATFTGRKIEQNDGIAYEEAVETFVQAMNEKVRELGARTSHFIHPDGYDAEGQCTTAKDLAIIARAFLECKKGDCILKQIVSLPSARACSTDGADLTWQNTNLFLQQDSKYYDSRVIGLKTGSSGDAGKCLVSAVVINKQTYIVVVMGDSEEGRYKDSKRIYRAISRTA